MQPLSDFEEDMFPNICFIFKLITVKCIGYQVFPVRLLCLELAKVQTVSAWISKFIHDLIMHFPAVATGWKKSRASTWLGSGYISDGC